MGVCGEAAPAQQASRSRLPRFKARRMVRRMLRPGALAALCLLLPLVAGCGVDVRADAAQGVARFLDAVRRDDRAGFEAAIDRPAVRADLRGQLADLARANGLDV